MSLLLRDDDNNTHRWKNGREYIRTTTDLSIDTFTRLSEFVINEYGPRRRNDAIEYILKSYLDEYDRIKTKDKEQRKP